MRNDSVAIVIPTHNRYKQLRVLLDSLKAHWIDNIGSVIVVDDSSDPENLELEYRSINLRQIVVKKRVFISKAKNIGWKETDTEYVYFIDDDNKIGGSTIKPVLQVIASSDSIGALMPAVLYNTRPDIVWVYATPLFQGRVKHRLVGRNLPRDATLEGKLLETDALPNASIVRRHALEEVGGFDERLVVNSSMDLCLRMKARKWGVFSYTGAFVYHDVEPPGRLGWWAVHGAVDPERVRYEIRDWFVITYRMRGMQRFFRFRAVFESRFVIPNMLAYMVRGRSRLSLGRALWKGYFEGLRTTTTGDIGLYSSRITQSGLSDGSLFQDKE